MQKLFPGSELQYINIVPNEKVSKKGWSWSCMDIITFVRHNFNMVLIINHKEGDIPQPQYSSKHCKYTLLVLFANMNSIQGFL